jgi:hypothetical protein
LMRALTKPAPSGGLQAATPRSASARPRSRSCRCL